MASATTSKLPLKTTKTINDFACRCDTVSLADCENVIKWAIEHLACEPHELVTNIIYVLRAEHNVDVVEITTDQWSLIRCNNESLATNVQCDMVEDGLARTLQIYAEQA